MSSSKLRKISKIVKEISMQSSQSTYDISGLDLSLCKFYYRTPQNLFKDLASGDYTIDTSSGQQSLVIQNDTVLQTGEAIQVCYSMDLTSSKYVVDFEVDVNRLTTSYNELVEDVHTLWEYIRKTGMIADDTTIDLILPQLNNNEVWVKSEDGYKGMPLDDVEQSVKDIIDKYSQQKIEEIKREVTTHVDSEIQRATNEITDVKDTSIQNIKDQEETSTNNMISEINKHTEKKKVELNDHEQLKEQELNDLHQQLSTRLQELIDGAVMDKGVLPINSDWHLLDRGNYYVIDLFNSNYKNHPINIVNQNEGQGIVMVGIADDGKTKIIRYYSTSKRMFFQVLTQSNVWSEWAVLGGGNGTIYEIAQNNHGFNFNAVSLDGLTSRWVLADKNTGADAVAIKIDDNRFQLLFNGQGIIPTSSRDDKGNEFIYDEYYFLSNTVNGAFQKDKPTYGLFQPLFHTRMVENKLVADVQIGDIHDLTQHIVDNETIKEYGIATEKDLLNKLDKVNTIEELKSQNLKVGDIVEVLGYYRFDDGATHKRVIADTDDGSGVQLRSGKWANIVHNGEVNVSWFGAKGDGITDDTLAFEKAIKNSEVILTAKQYKIKKLNFNNKCNIRSITSDTIVYSDGFVLNSPCIIENFQIINNHAKETGSGILFNSSYCTCRNVSVFDYNICFDISSMTESIIIILLDGCIANGYTAAFKIGDKSNTVQTNQITLNRCYATACGVNGTDTLAPATNGYGYGYYIFGGYSITLSDCIAEYCSGGGMYISANEKRVCNGLHITNNFFENNKKAQIYIECTSYLRSSRIENCFFSTSLAANSADYLKDIYLKDIHLLLGSWFNIGDTKNENKIETLSNTNILDYSLKKYNSVSMLSAIDLLYQYTDNIGSTIEKDENESLYYKATFKDYGLNLSDIPIKSNQIYKVSYKYKRVDSLSNSLKDIRYIEKDGKQVFLSIREITKSETYETAFNYFSTNSPGNAFLKGYLEGVVDGNIIYYKDFIFEPISFANNYIDNFQYPQDGFMLLDLADNKLKLYINGKWTEIINNVNNQVAQLGTSYYSEKMKQENVYDDYITYMDEKTLYDKKQRKIEEPQPSENLKRFMQKYL